MDVDLQPYNQSISRQLLHLEDYCPIRNKGKE
jgi:hypothetical protein